MKKIGTTSNAPDRVLNEPHLRQSPSVVSDSTESPHPPSPQTPTGLFEPLETPTGLSKLLLGHNERVEPEIVVAPTPSSDDRLDEATRRLRDLRTGTSPVFQGAAQPQVRFGPNTYIGDSSSWVYTTPSPNWGQTYQQQPKAPFGPRGARNRTIPIRESSIWTDVPTSASVSNPWRMEANERTGLPGSTTGFNWEPASHDTPREIPMPAPNDLSHLPPLALATSPSFRRVQNRMQSPSPARWQNLYQTPRVDDPAIGPDGVPTQDQTFIDWYKMPRSKGFLPMQAVSFPQRNLFPASYPDMAVAPMIPSGLLKFSSRYHGMHTENNASAEHIPPELNCALWLTNLPPDVSVHELLRVIRHVGRIWCSYINKPDNITHQTAAAKVVFFTPDAAQRLLSLSWTRGLVIRGYRIKAGHNRIKYQPRELAVDLSRVLIITGNARFVNEESLTRYFEARFVFQVDEVLELIENKNRAVVEYRFGSYRCQAQMGKMSLEKDRPAGFEKVEFGEDPCETGIDDAAYKIAADRIRGLGL